MDKNIAIELNEASSDLLKIISSFSQDEFNKVPFEGSWTAGQVSEHLLKSFSGVPDALMGNTIPTERDPTEKEPALRSIFLDFSTKLESPDFILPSIEPKQTTKMAAELEETFIKLQNIISKEDLSLTCTDFPFPGLGELTRYEWICFVTYHAKRHTHQMKNIYSKLNK